MLKVLKTGFYTSIQDMGRFGHRHKGVPVSGCMDQIAMEQCNSLLENDKDAPVFEITMTGPTLQFDAPTYISIAGAEMSPMLNDKPIKNCHVYKIKPSDILSFDKLEKGFRAYLAVKGGFKVEKVLNSFSQYKSLTTNATLLKNQEVKYLPIKDFSPLILEMKPDNYLEGPVLEVYKGPEFELLGENQLDELFGHYHTVAKENNRMAYQLKETIKGSSAAMLTSGTLPGTVQLTPSGKLIVLMRDGQTTGGYPRILQLTEKAISVLSQKKTGDQFKFELVYN